MTREYINFSSWILGLARGSVLWSDPHFTPTQMIQSQVLERCWGQPLRTHFLSPQMQQRVKMRNRKRTAAQAELGKTAPSNLYWELQGNSGRLEPSLGTSENSLWPFWICSCGEPNTYIGERNDNPLQYSCLENPMDRGAWRATVHGVIKNQTWLSNTFTFQNLHMKRLTGRPVGSGCPTSWSFLSSRPLGFPWTSALASNQAPSDLRWTVAGRSDAKPTVSSLTVFSCQFLFAAYCSFRSERNPVYSLCTISSLNVPFTFVHYLTPGWSCGAAFPVAPPLWLFSVLCCS